MVLAGCFCYCAAVVGAVMDDFAAPNGPTLKFKLGRTQTDYWTAEGVVEGHEDTWYTVVGPRDTLGIVPYTLPDKWTASRANDFIANLLGTFYLHRYDSREEAMTACAEDFKSISRVYQWVEFMKTHSPLCTGKGPQWGHNWECPNAP